jgi:hypothetical protein
MNDGSWRHMVCSLLVVNEDGSLRRIANWAEMSEREKENTLRVLTKRNAMRLKKIKVCGLCAHVNTGMQQIARKCNKSVYLHTAHSFKRALDCSQYLSFSSSFVLQEDRENLLAAAQTSGVVPDVVQTLHEVVYNFFHVQYSGVYDPSWLFLHGSFCFLSADRFWQFKELHTSDICLCWNQQSMWPYPFINPSYVYFHTCKCHLLEPCKRTK